MKKLLILAVILSLTSVACKAFQDSYSDSPGTLTSQPPVDNSSNGGASGDGSAKIDYSVDKTECAAMAEISVVKSADADTVKATELNVAADGDVLSTIVKKDGSFTNTITILSGDKKEIVSMTIKQTGEKDFAVCKVVYEDKKVKSGEITIDSFNVGKELVNAGALKLVFDVAADATKTATDVNKDLLKAEDKAEGESVEGTYYAKGLILPDTKK